MSKQGQLDLLEPEQIWLRSLLGKVEGLIDPVIFDHLSRCGQEEIFQTCRQCGKITTRYYRCSLKFCPQCNWRIARRRAEELRVWSTLIRQPKHLVLTCRNAAIFTRRRIRDFQKAFAQLRRSKVFEEVRGGCISLEITNEGKGWHLHGHCLLDARWINMEELSRKWGALVGQSFAIVKIKDCRGNQYLGEVVKYAVKPAQLVAWEPEEIAQFIRAIRGVRMFAVFGDLFHKRKEIRDFLKQTKPAAVPCACGSSDFYFETEEAAILHEVQRAHGRRR